MICSCENRDGFIRRLLCDGPRSCLEEVQGQGSEGETRGIGVFHVRPEKTPKVLVEIPIQVAPQAALDATPLGGLTFVAAKGGKPCAKFSFGARLRDQGDAAGCPGSARAADAKPARAGWRSLARRSVSRTRSSAGRTARKRRRSTPRTPIERGWRARR
jgi:hypothetical protein